MMPDFEEQIEKMVDEMINEEEEVKKNINLSDEDLNQLI
jgi:hypothetical protein